jgi:lantibiotic modifying enzyme
MLRSLALEGDDGTAVWLAPRQDVAAGLMTMSGANQAFGDGCLGVALFLAALARVTGAPFAASLAGQAARPPEMNARYRSLVAPRLGVVEGLGGQVWGYTAIARVGGPEWCLDAAADAFTTGIGHLNATEWTVADGLAGLLLGGLALRARAPELVALDALDALAGRVAALATAAVAPEAGLLTGLTGAGLALARAAIALDAPALRGTAFAALAAEGEAADGIGWGRGAAGRLLARQAAMKLLDGGRWLAAMNRADVSAVAGADAPGCDGLWRGGAGLLPAMASVDRRRAVDMARQLGARAVAGRLAPVAPALPDVAFPGLLNGVAGIGYALLRTVDASLPDLHLFG